MERDGILPVTSRVTRRRKLISSIFLCDEDEAEFALFCMRSSMRSATVSGERSVVSPLTCQGRSVANESALSGITTIQDRIRCMGDMEMFMVAFSHRVLCVCGKR